MKSQILLPLLFTVSVWESAAQTVESILTNRLAEPYTVAVEANVYYLSDSANDRIVKYIPDTAVFSTLAGFAGRPGSADGKGVFARFFNPRGLVSVPARGGLVVSDYANHTLRLVQLDGTVTTLAGTPGVAGFEAGATPAANAHFNFPSALAVDTNGNVYIADSKNNAIRKLDLANVITTIAASFSEPSGIAVGDNGDLWIADTRDHTIRRLRPNGTVEVAAGIPGQSGYVDSIFSNETLFNSPTALLWVGGMNGLLVSDTGNHALRRVFTDPEIGGYSVETFAGSPPQSGFVDGGLRQARFNLPTGVVKDPSGGFLVADLGNSALRRIQTSKPQPPVADPILGYVTFEKDTFGELLSKLVPVTQGVFNNDVTIAIMGEPATETYFTYGPTPPSALEDTIPSPNRLTGNSPPVYRDGLHVGEVAPSIVSPQPDVTIKVIGTQDGRRPSSVVQGRFQFKTANPSILGDNAALFIVTNITFGAQMWYTTDGSEPSPNGPTSQSAVSGPLSLPRSSVPIDFKIRAFRTGYRASETVSKVFQPEDFQANRISFGFETGEASSEFVASPGQTFFAPVTLTLLPKQSMYTLQMNLTVTNLIGPAVTPGAVGFASMLKENIVDDLFRTIPPAFFLNGATVPPQVQNPPLFGDLQVTNPAVNLLAVGWLERLGQTNLYDTAKQDLITYSIAHDNLFLSRDQQVVVGGYTFVVPTNAAPGDQYQIQIGRPSATADGIGRDNYIEPILDGTLTSTPTNLMNSIKIVTVASRQYVVGDAAPFRWFNAGDFGEGLLLNNDVVQVFQSAVYQLDNPPVGSDFFDAMDSSDGSNNSVFLGNDTVIDTIQFGDGSLNVDDIYVTFRRSLDPTLAWYARYWDNGVRQAVQVPNRFRGSPNLPGERWTAAQPALPAEAFIPGTPSMTWRIDDAQVRPGQTLQIPVRSRVVGSYPARVVMLNIAVEPLDGSPSLASSVEFAPAAGLGDPTMTASKGNHSFAGAWLNNTVPGLAGEAVVGHLKVTIPADAPADAAYRVRFEHASASPNGLALLPRQVHDGLLTLSDRTTASLGDGIPDSWRLRYFGSVTGWIAGPSADADGDGASNLAEFKAGTHPVDGRSNFHVAAHRFQSSGAPGSLTLRWLSMRDKSYTVEGASSLLNPTWTPVGSSLMGTGEEMLFTPVNLENATRFFRVRLAE